ncbi:NAD(P)-binding protein [Clavulina sp. PMI_390]|nr:NAD(P)-binding protein [Clavulina sp. PMI_390]
MAARILVVAGIGAGKGTGGAVARKFAANGYKVALIARGADSLNKLSAEIKSAGGSAAPFPVAAYSSSELSSAFSKIKAEWPNAALRVAVYNVGEGIWKEFLDITETDLEKIKVATIDGAFAFSKEAIKAFKEVDLDERGTRGTLIFTSATAATRGNVLTSAFASGKFAERALSQSLAKAYGKENIHVSNVIIDGSIATERNDKGNPDEQLQPEAIAEAYEYLANQHRSAYTWEMDLRPSHEKW